MKAQSLVLVIAGLLFVGCGGSNGHNEAEGTWSVTVADNITDSATALLPFGNASASGSYPVATVQSRDIPPPVSEIIVRVRAAPRKPVRGSYTVRCYGQDGSEIRSGETQLHGSPPIQSRAIPTIHNPEYCQVDGQVSYAENTGGRIDLSVLGRLPSH